MQLQPANDESRLVTSAVQSPRHSELDIYAVSLPARAFTGDFYFISRQSERTWIAVGDVAGKGLHAAVFMAMIHEELERLSARAEGPAELAATLNATLAAHLPDNRFVTAAVATIDPTGWLEIVNAGHCPVLIRRENEIKTVSATGPVLGVFTSPSWKTRRLLMQPRDSVLLFTDGLLEAQSQDGSEFGLERATTSFASAPDHDATAAGKALLREVEPFRRHDDLTLVLLRRR